MVYFPAFLKEVKSIISVSCIHIHADKGKEYSPLADSFDSVTLTTTTGYNPQHNGISERINRTLKYMARALLISANLPHSFWPDAIEQSARLYNQVPYSTIGKTPAGAIFGSKPSVKNWSVIGAKCFVTIPKEKQSGFNAKALTGILIGCSKHGIYRIFTERGEVVESKHVQLDESNYPGLSFLKKNDILGSDASDFEQDSSHELWEPDANAGNDSTTVITSICIRQIVVLQLSPNYSMWLQWMKRCQQRALYLYLKMRHPSRMLQMFQV